MKEIMIFGRYFSSISGEGATAMNPMLQCGQFLNLVVVTSCYLRVQLTALVVIFEK